MASDRGRINFREPYPFADVGDTGYQIHVHSAVPQGAGYSCFLAVWNGEVKATRDDALVTNPDGRWAFTDWIGVQLGLQDPTGDDGIVTGDDGGGTHRHRNQSQGDDGDDGDDESPLCSNHGWRLAWLKACEQISVNLQRAIDAQQAEQTVDKPAGASQASRLVELAKEAGLFHTSEGEAYATIPVQGHRETWQIKTKGFRRWLARRYYEANESAPGAQALQDALTVLEGKALFDSPELAVDTRLAEHEGTVYLDLADAEWRAVRIDATGWQVVSDPPVRFRRSKGMLPLPLPARGGSLDELRPFLNVASNDDWRLRVGWLIGAMRPRGPYPALVLHGEQGSAKSTAQRVLRRLIDPNVADLRSEPREERDLLIASTNGWVVAYDNLSHLPVWLSDALCRVMTGSGLGTRELFSDTDETLFSVMRPVMLNGIEELATRGDLLDRCIVQYQPVIARVARRAEEAFWQEFEAARPRILGALLDVIATALEHLPTTRLDELPRMADFALWVTAAEAGLGWEVGTFVQTYGANQAAANELSLEASPIVAPLRAFLDEQADKTWQGAATPLLKGLAARVDEATLRLRTWPRQGNALSNGLRRLAPNLRAAGVEVTFGREAHTGRRSVHLELKCDPSSPSSPSSPWGDSEFKTDPGPVTMASSPASSPIVTGVRSTPTEPDSQAGPEYIEVEL